MHWLLLRGLSREQRHWGAFPAAFERHNPGARVHFLDLPGAGTEHDRPSPTSIEAIMEDLRLRWLKLREENEGPWGLLAMSLGGMVAMAWADVHPEDFERVVLSGTSASNLSAADKRFRFGIVPSIARAMVERDPVHREEIILGAVTNQLPDASTVAAEWASYQADRPVARGTVIRQLLAASRFEAPKRLDVPVLVVTGTADRMVDPSCTRLLASQLGARFDLCEGAGHELALDDPEWLAGRVASWVASSASRPAVSKDFRVAPLGGEGTVPLVIEPASHNSRSLEALLPWLGENRERLAEQLTTHGAILLRGFDVDGAADFERVSRAFDADLKKDYLGTSPRNALTEYVFSASELPPYYPIAQHCEMSFLREPPRRLFFSCLTPSGGPGGETPLADFRAVYRDLHPETRARFDEKGVRHVRNYEGPEGKARFDLWKLKRWDDMFQSTDRAVVERKCVESGFEFTWRDGGRLRLTNTQPATKKHPVTGETVWFNHSQVFHLSSVPAEYRNIAARQGQARYATLAAVAEAAVALKKRTTGEEDHAMHATFGDGSPISDSDMDEVRRAIWKNMVFFKWRKGDVLVIDNDSVSHGRMPFSGPRTVAVSWA